MCEVFSRSSMQPFDQQPRSRGQYPTSYTPAESAPSHPYFGPYNIPSTQDLQLPRPILPPMLPSIARHSPSSVSSKSDDPHCRKKRQQIPAACESCRKRKGKCDGGRPTCAACIKRNEACVYTVEPDLSRTENLRRRYDQLQVKADQSDQLLQYLKTKPEGEALEILRRMRHDEYDAPSLLRYIQDGELLIQQPRRGAASKSTFVVAPGVSLLNDEEMDHTGYARSARQNSGSFDNVDPCLRRPSDPRPNSYVL